MPGPAGPAGTGAVGEELGGFVGFTSAKFTGAIPNGRPGAHAACAAEFAGAHLCHISEYLLANSAVPITDDKGAWLDMSADAVGETTSAGLVSSGRSLEGGCSHWTEANPAYRATYLDRAGSAYGGDCNVARALACCNAATNARFAGFTSARSNGAVGGRAAMHNRCRSEFPGSHFCHAAEYVRANSATPAPASGAWLDQSSTPRTTSTTAGIPGAGRAANSGCATWTESSAAYRGLSVSPSGIYGADCVTSQATACCY